MGEGERGGREVVEGEDYRAEGRLNNVLCLVNLSCWFLNYTSSFIND